MVEAMQPSSSRAGMTTESSESGRVGGLKRIQNSAKLVDFFGFQRGVVADVEAVEVDMLDLGMVFVFVTEQSAKLGRVVLVGDISDFQATSQRTSGWFFIRLRVF